MCISLWALSLPWTWVLEAFFQLLRFRCYVSLRNRKRGCLSCFVQLNKSTMRLWAMTFGKSLAQVQGNTLLKWRTNPLPRGPSWRWEAVRKHRWAWRWAPWTPLHRKQSPGEDSPVAAGKGWLRGSVSRMDPVLALCFLKIMMMNEMTNELWYSYKNPPVLSCLLFFSYSRSCLQIHSSNSLMIQTHFPIKTTWKCPPHGLLSHLKPVSLANDDDEADLGWHKPFLHVVFDGSVFCSDDC